MKTIAVLAALVAVACGAAVPQQRRQVFAHSAAPVHHVTASPVHLSAPLHAAPAVHSRSYGSDANVVLLKETPSNNIGLDNYQFAYELSDGSARDENAHVEVRGPEDGVLRVQGSYRFVGTDGQTYTITYVADENGFQPQGAHLPVPPNHL